jgi:hypothetical protein
VSAIRIVILTAILLGATHLMFGMQWMVGAFEFPGDIGRRIGCAYKDAVIIYPFIIILFVAHPLHVQRIGSGAWSERRAGRVCDRRWEDSQRHATENPGWRTLIERSIVLVGLVMLWLFAEDLAKATSHNLILAAHILFQIVLPIALGLIVAMTLSVPGAFGSHEPGR